MFQSLLLLDTLSIVPVIGQDQPVVEIAHEGCSLDATHRACRKTRLELTGILAINLRLGSFMIIGNGL
ncbi:MAG: hypothetical protein ABW068_11115, partial [Candidatus Thiodiazotropha sp.]